MRTPDRRVKEIRFECRRLSSVVIYDISHGNRIGLHVTPKVIIPRKLSAQQGSSCFTIPGVDAGMYLSERVVGNPGEKHYVINYPGINTGTPDSPQWETLIPADIILRVVETIEEKIVWEP